MKNSHETFQSQCVQWADIIYNVLRVFSGHTYVSIEHSSTHMYKLMYTHVHPGTLMNKYVCMYTHVYSCTCMHPCTLPINNVNNTLENEIYVNTHNVATHVTTLELV